MTPWLGEVVGHVGWRYSDEESPAPENYTVYVEVGYATYSCARAEGIWRKCSVPIEATSLEFRSPLGKTVAQCLTAPNTCRYILFTDGTALRVFNEPPAPGWVTIHSHAAAFLHPEEVRALLERYPNITETPVLQDNEERPAPGTRRYYPVQGTLLPNASLSLPWFCITTEGERQDGTEEIAPTHPQYASWYPIVHEETQRLMYVANLIREFV